MWHFTVEGGGGWVGVVAGCMALFVVRGLVAYFLHGGGGGGVMVSLVFVLQVSYVYSYICVVHLFYIGVVHVIITSSSSSFFSSFCCTAVVQFSCVLSVLPGIVVFWGDGISGFRGIRSLPGFPGI